MAMMASVLPMVVVKVIRLFEHRAVVVGKLIGCCWARVGGDQLGGLLLRGTRPGGG